MEDVQGIAEEMKRDVDRLAEVVTPELVVALVDAFRELDGPVEDARELLASRGVELPSDIELIPGDVSVRTGTEATLVGPEEGPVRVGGGRMCEKTVQLSIRRGGHAPLALPSLVLCVGWA